MAMSDSELDSKSDDNREEARVSGDAAERKAGVFSGELDLRPSESEANARVTGDEGSENGGVARFRVSEENVAEREMGRESRVLGGNSESNSSSVQFDPENDEFDPEEEISDEKSDKVEVYSSLLSEFDDFVANEKHGALAATSRALTYGFEVGDLVWGKVKSHPWWPGHIFNEAFASSSVRRTRRDGHVLVAFFGDSSYGWFDPAELIPFDPHFAEKSQQTNSRNFVKAVEEAVDEASRRRGLGLVCKCRNRHNFKPSKEQGYFLVDVPEYEPAGVYSVSQINKARDSFQPVETLSFVKQLASEPGGSDGANIDFIKNKATVVAFRRAVFEKEDMTYAQAFGMQPRPPSETANVADQPVKEPTRAPLSGPLVIAEALGGGKSSKKPMKVKDQLKKDRYLFKRRDEPSDSNTLDIDQRQASTSTAAVYGEGLSVVEASNYVLQKRVTEPHVAVEHEHTGFISKEGAGCNEDLSGKEKVNQSPGHLDALAAQGAILDAKPSSDKEINALQGTKDSKGVDVVGKGLLHIARDGVSPSSQQENGTMINSKDEEGAKTPQPKEAEKQTEQKFSAKVEGDGGLQKLQDGLPGSHLSSFNAKHSSGMSADGGMKKPKTPKRPVGDMSSGSSTTGEKKKKKELGAEKSPDLPKKHLVASKAVASGGGSVGKSTQMALSHREDPRINHQKKDTGAVTSSFRSSNAPLALSGMVIVDLELPQLLSDLHALALDPFYGLERNSPLNAVQFFLRFRSLVYKKSLVLSPPLETEPVDVSISKSQSSVRASVNSAGEHVKEDLMPSKPVKSLVRPGDPSKSGRKRMPSDRQEEMAAKKLKRIDQLKSLAAEKKASQRNFETQRPEGKEFGTVAQAKPIKSSSVKKLEPLTRAIEPTMLVMKFPPQTSLPSVAELKARFARFGSIDLSAIRVFWQSSTCRIVFRHKADAHAAYKYAVGNKSLFGNVNVRYNLREVGSSASEAPEPEKVRGDETFVEAPRVKDPPTGRPAQAILHQPFPQPRVQPKSILKKSAGDEVGQVNEGNGGKGTPRVKFMLGGEDASRGEQLMVGHRNSFNNSAILADGGAPSSSVAMDFNSKNFQKIIPPSSLPILPLPAQFANAPLNNVHPTEVAPRHLPNFDIPSAAPSTPSIDISQEMLGLLTRCNDVVTSATGLLGYLPYHPL